MHFELIQDLALSGAKPANTPMEQNSKLTTYEYDQAVKDKIKTDFEDQLLDDREAYQRLIGRLIYLTQTRPDITYAVRHLSQFMHMPKVSHHDAATRIVKYVKGSPGRGLFFPAEVNNKMRIFCDADWASRLFTRRSLSEFCVKIGNVLVSWKTKKQDVVSRSSTEAEYRSLALAISEATWLLRLFGELHIQINVLAQVFCDNKPAIQIAKNPVFHERTKHIEIDCHIIREKKLKKLVDLQHITIA